MTAFAPSDEHNPHQPPPQPPLQHDAFAHQISSTNPRIAPRSQPGDYRHTSSPSMAAANGNAPMPVPAASHGRMSNANGHAHANIRDMGFATGPRSPPNNKSTSHVPCKFYRQGACQAGKACPFLHSDEPLTERAPCKYFTKGNCKFGPKCALAHILPNGHIVNRHNVGGGQAAGGPFGRMNIPHHPDPAPNSSLLTMQAHMAPMQPYPAYPQDEYLAGQKSHYDMIPTIDTTFSSHPGSNYGSPPNENSRAHMSPPIKGLTVADVGLPASFDSQGISEMARWGPIASSVPAKFLANSPPSSFTGDSSALRHLHNSAFGNGSHRATALGSSPPESVEQPAGRRIMHSELGAHRSRGMLSASVGARAPFASNDEWDDSDLIGKFEEDMLPSSLNDLLTPDERFRRFSRDQGDNDGNSLSHRGSMSRLGASPPTSDLKFGSPSGATSSPSRYHSLWGKRPVEPVESGSVPQASQFGHVGSPLRNSSLHPGASPSLRALSRPLAGDTSPFLSSPPRQASMSMISQQLQRTRLSSRASEEGAPSLSTNPPVGHPGINRLTSSSSIGSSGGRLGIDRAVSSSSINRERIEEEQGLFSMEEEDDVNANSGKSKDGASTTSSNTSNKRLSGLSWGSAGGGKASPSLAPIGGRRPPGKF